MMNSKISHVICLWEWVETKEYHQVEGYSTNWKLVESYATDADGYTLTPVKDERPGKHYHERFMSAGEMPIMGRMVTAFSFGSGVVLVDFHPPEFVKWMGVEWFDVIQQQKHWYRMFHDGFYLIDKTVSEASRIIVDGALKIIDKDNKK